MIQIANKLKLCRKSVTTFSKHASKQESVLASTARTILATKLLCPAPSSPPPTHISHRSETRNAFQVSSRQKRLQLQHLPSAHRSMANLSNSLHMFSLHEQDEPTNPNALYKKKKNVKDSSRTVVKPRRGTNQKT